MYNDDSPLGAFVGVLFLGGMYALGRHQGQNKVRREWEDHNRDQEIMKLRQELESLKASQTVMIEEKK